MGMAIKYSIVQGPPDPRFINMFAMPWGEKPIAGGFGAVSRAKISTLSRGSQDEWLQIDPHPRIFEGQLAQSMDHNTRVEVS